ncbi:hypothetical protein Gasu2_01710 [Galdieria sulphuraria]|nr:hypothetical protein Gasu2_01710 [Galdieria sulphuraria]
MVRWNTSQILLVCSVLFLAYVTNPSESSFWTYIREKVGVESVGEKRNIRNIAQPLKWVDGILKSVFGLHRLPVRSRLKVFGIWIPLPRIISFLRNLRFHAWMLKATLFERVQAANLLWNPYELIVMLSTVFYLCWYLSPAFMRKHFTLSWHNIRQGRLWCIILCHLSQNSIFQLFRTLNSYYVLIPLLVRLIGSNIQFINSTRAYLYSIFCCMHIISTKVSFRNFGLPYITFRKFFATHCYGFLGRNV